MKEGHEVEDDRSQEGVIKSMSTSDYMGEGSLEWQKYDDFICEWSLKPPAFVYAYVC